MHKQRDIHSRIALEVQFLDLGYLFRAGQRPSCSSFRVSLNIRASKFWISLQDHIFHQLRRFFKRFQLALYENPWRFSPVKAKNHLS